MDGLLVCRLISSRRRVTVDSRTPRQTNTRTDRHKERPNRKQTTHTREERKKNLKTHKDT